jgi:hypothetical protein
LSHPDPGINKHYSNDKIGAMWQDIMHDYKLYGEILFHLILSYMSVLFKVAAKYFKHVWETSKLPFDKLFVHSVGICGIVDHQFKLSFHKICAPYNL